MNQCPTFSLAVRIPGQERPRLNLFCPLYGKTKRGRKRADFTRTAKLSIQMIDRRVTA